MTINSSYFHQFPSYFTLSTQVKTKFDESEAKQTKKNLFPECLQKEQEKKDKCWMCQQCLILLVLAQHPGILWGRRQKPSLSAVTWLWLPEWALLPAPSLQCKSSFHMSRAITGTPRTLVFCVTPPGDSHTHMPLLFSTPCLTLLPLKGTGYLGVGVRVCGGRLYWCVCSYGGALPQAVSTHTSSQSHSSPSPLSHCSHCISLVLTFANKCWLP